MRVYKIPQGKSAINDAQIHVFDIPFISLSIIFLNRLGDPSHMRYHVFMKEFLTAFQHELIAEIRTGVYASELGRKLREKGETFRDITQKVPVFYCKNKQGELQHGRTTRLQTISSNLSSERRHDPNTHWHSVGALFGQRPSERQQGETGLYGNVRTQT